MTSLTVEHNTAISSYDLNDEYFLPVCIVFLNPMCLDWVILYTKDLENKFRNFSKKKNTIEMFGSNDGMKIRKYKLGKTLSQKIVWSQQPQKLVTLTH